ncbi:MAG: Unknown protein [uncultured Sulfurovum sp.]|uniref:Uncharacterized protein n=1 Tax=uncultured Sulfurovum sp. TaxID=269237 RepID=A0A6S6TDC0_9BACT|nr:MAG: Unknown protein [uncultured Sulfurovum sp.]
MQKVIRNILILLFAFNLVLVANSTVDNPSYIASSVESGEVTQGIETVEIGLNSFGTLGIIIMVALSSLLGAFFMKDELSDAFKQ